MTELTREEMRLAGFPTACSRSTYALAASDGGGLGSLGRRLANNKGGQQQIEPQHDSGELVLGKADPVGPQPGTLLLLLLALAAALLLRQFVAPLDGTSTVLGFKIIRQ